LRPADLQAAADQGVGVSVVHRRNRGGKIQWRLGRT
jgi:hypothetical protein